MYCVILESVSILPSQGKHTRFHNLTENLMTRLIQAYRRLPSPTNRRRLQAYLDAHKMAQCLLADADRQFLTEHDFTL